MPTATAASEIAPPPHPRDELKSLALEADQFYASDDWKSADAPTRQKYLDRSAEIFDEAFKSAESSLDEAEADSFYNSTTAFLQGKMAEHNKRVTGADAVGVLGQSFGVAQGMAQQTIGSGVMRAGGTKESPAVEVQPLDWSDEVKRRDEAMKSVPSLAGTRRMANRVDDDTWNTGSAQDVQDLKDKQQAQKDWPLRRAAFAKQVGMSEKRVDDLLDERDMLDGLKAGQAFKGPYSGEVYVSPDLALMQDEYDKAVDATDATPEKKAKAKAHRLKVRDQLAGKIEFSLAAVDPEWEKWSAGMAGEMKDASVGEKVERFIKWRKASGAKMSAIDRAVDQNAASFVKQFFGLIGGITNIGMMKEAAATAGEIERANEQIRSVMGGAGATGFAVDLIGVLAPTIAFSPLARLATTNLGAMRLMAGIGAAQGYGGKYVDASAAYSEQGLSDQEAHMKAQLPALASALTTYALARMMPRGVESIGQINSAKNAAKTAYRKFGGKLLADVKDEWIEESAQATIDEVVAKFTYDPKKDMRTALENIFMSGLMGGIGGGVVGAVSRYANKVKPILETAEQMRKDGYPLAAAETEKTAEIEATKQYWADVAKAQKRAVERAQSDAGLVSAEGAQDAKSDLYNAFGNVQRKAGGFLGLPDAGNPEGTPKAQPSAEQWKSAWAAQREIYTDADGRKRARNTVVAPKVSEYQPGDRVVGFVDGKAGAVTGTHRDGVTVTFDDGSKSSFNNMGGIVPEDALRAHVKDAAVDANYKPEPAKESEPKNEKAQSVPSVQKADESVRLPQKEVAPAAPSPEPVTPAASHAQTAKEWEGANKRKLPQNRAPIPESLSLPVGTVVRAKNYGENEGDIVITGPLRVNTSGIIEYPADFTGSGRMASVEANEITEIKPAAALPVGSIVNADIYKSEGAPLQIVGTAESRDGRPVYKAVVNGREVTLDSKDISEVVSKPEAKAELPEPKPVPPVTDIVPAPAPVAAPTKGRADMLNPDTEILDLARKDTEALPSTLRMPLDDAVKGVVVGASSPVDQMAHTKPERFAALHDAFANTREALRRKYGDTITLYRAQGSGKEAAVASWDTTPKAVLNYASRENAKRYVEKGRKLVSRNVRVDDIVAVYSPASGYNALGESKALKEHYEEYIVRVEPAAPSSPAPAAAAPLLPKPIIKALLRSGHEVVPAGPQQAGFRSLVMEKIGKKVPQSKAGLTAVTKALAEYLGVDTNDTAAGVEAKMREKLTDMLAAHDAPTPSSPAPAATPAPAPVAQGAAKEPWMMTQEEWVRRDLVERKKVGLVDSTLDEMVASLVKAGDNPARALADMVRLHSAGHEVAVEQALREGKPVPESVLADYPELAPKPAPEPVATPQSEGGIFGYAWADIRSKQQGGKLAALIRGAAVKPKATEADLKLLESKGAEWLYDNDKRSIIDRLGLPAEKPSKKAEVKPKPPAQSFTEKVRAKIVPGAKVSVQLVRGAKLAHPAVVGDVFLDSNGKPESVSVTFDGGGNIKKGRTQTVPFGNVSLRPGVESRMLTNEQFEGMTKEEAQKTRAAAKEFKKLVIEYPELGFYSGHLEAVTAGPQGEAAIKKARADAYVKAMTALGVHPDKADARDAVTQASLVEKLRELTKKPGMERKQYADFQEAKEEGDGEIKAGDLKYGETINIGGEEMRVTDIDKDGVVTLQDGEKFGTQEVHPDESLMIKGETPEPVAPKLRPSDGKGTGELLQGEAAPFNLVAETAADISKREAREAAEQIAKDANDAAEAKAKQDKEQANLFDDDPFTIADTAPATSLPVESVQRAVRVVAGRLAGAMPHEVIADGSQYPQRVKDAFRKKYGASGDLNRIRGVVVGGRIYINAAAIENAREAIETFMHEAAGHGGVDALLKAFGEKATTQLDAMLKRLFKDDYAAVQRSYEPHEQVSETLARIMQGVGPEMSAQTRTRWQRVMDWLRNALNNLGVKRWSTNDVMALLRRGVDAVRKSRAATPDAGAVRMSVAPEQDRAYADAVARGDMETAQRMVDEAAKRSGYTVGPVWHGTDKEFTVFDDRFYGAKTRTGGNYGRGFYFTGRSTAGYDQADWLGSEGKLGRFYLRVENPAPWREAQVDPVHEKEAGIASATRKRDELIQKGHDGAIIPGRKTEIGEVVVFDPSQIKSADPITRDASGKVIPLSERFNPESSDIRFSLKPEPPLSTAQYQRHSELERKHDAGTITAAETAEAERIVAEAARAAGYGTGPMLHGTTHKFTVFDYNRANLENDFGKGHYFTNTQSDADANYAGIGPDLTGRIQRRAEQIFNEMESQPLYGKPGYKKAMDKATRMARKELAGKHATVLKTYIKLDSPAVLGGENPTRLEMSLPMDESGDFDGEPTGTLVQFINAVRNEASRYDDADVNEAASQIEQESNYESIKLSEAIDILRHDERLSSATDENGDLASNEIIRAALERMGFDGIVDHTVDQKFGSQRRTGKQMSGMDEDTFHIIAFRPESIKSADPFTRDSDGNPIPLRDRFNADSSDIRFSLKDENPEPPSPGAPSDTLPGGDPAWNWDRTIDPWAKRVIHGGRFIWEGTADVMRRAGFTKLADAAEKQYDVMQREFGRAWKPLHDALESMSRKEQNVAKDEWSQYFRHKESGRADEAAATYDAASTGGKAIIDGWKAVAEATGLHMREVGVEVRDGDTWRPIGLLGQGFFPRKISREVMKVISDPVNNPVEWARLVADLIANGNIAEASEAEPYLRKNVYHDESKYDHFANIEKARNVKLPESWLDYSFNDVAPWYVTHYARRIGQIEAYGQAHKDGGDLFDKELATVPTTKNYEFTREYLESAKETAYWTRPNTTGSRVLRNMQTVATAQFLSSPYSALRNVVSGLIQTVVQYGPLRTMQAAFTAMTSSAARMDAHDRGIIRRDIMHMMMEGRDDLAVSKALMAVTSAGLTVTGFNYAETINRTASMLAAQNFARWAAREISNDPDGAGALQSKAFLVRHGIDPDEFAKENGTGPLTDKFVRNSVRQGQGGYNMDQIPLWQTKPVAAFLTQFGRWGSMMARFVVKHAINPAVFGTKVKLSDGTTTTVRTMRPLLYALASAIGGGELLWWLREKLTGRGRNDDSLEKIGKDIKAEKFGTLLSRVFSDITMAGTLGIIGDYANSFVEFTARGRYKDPFSPPGIQWAKGLFESAVTLKQQGKLSFDDMRDLLEKQFPGVKFTKAAVEHLTGDKSRAAVNAKSAAYSAGIRMAKEQGLPVIAPFNMAIPVRTPNTPFYRDLTDALMVGDAAKARTLWREHLKSTPREERKRLLTGMKTSISQHQPISVGGIEGKSKTIAFFRWAKKSVPKEDYERFKALHKTYWKTAEKAGLVSENPYD